MHEASVAVRILETVEGYKGLQSVFVTVGRKSCVHPDMLKNAFDTVKQGTPVAFAELVVLPGPGEDITVLSVEVNDVKD
jgi:Zn finger protein HypA/HybF involved in hydrogenase expression